MRIFSKPLRVNRSTQRLFKTIIHLALLGWLGGLFYLAGTDQLGADPVEALLNQYGETALQLLLITLVIAPLARTLPCGDLIQFRRIIGIYVFVFALAHVATYAVFELQLDLNLLAEELSSRPYIIVGLVALVLLLAKTITSPMAMRRRMGRSWQRLHNTIYLTLLLALLHYSWSQKTVLQEPLLYWFVGIGLLAMRWPMWRKAIIAKRQV